MSHPPEQAAEPTQVEQGQSSAQDTRPWYLTKNANAKKPHTVIEPLICGAEAFGAVEEAIINATERIDIITWGFDPSLRLSGSAVVLSDNLAPQSKNSRARTTCTPYLGGYFDAGNKPRIGDLLLFKASQNVKVRILVWNDVLARLMRVDEHLPESGPKGNGLDAPLHRTLWRAKLGVAENVTPSSFCRSLVQHSDVRLSNYGSVLADYKRHYEEAFSTLNNSREAKERDSSGLEALGDWWESRDEASALKQLKTNNQGLLKKYWSGYPCVKMNMAFMDSPLTQVDDHYYNAEWFSLLRMGKKQGQTWNESYDNAPAWLNNIELRYRGQNRVVDGGSSAAMRRINRVAARLEMLLPKINANPAFHELSNLLQNALLWWNDNEILRPGNGFAEKQRRAIGNMINYLETHDPTNIFGIRDYLAEILSFSILKWPIEKVKSMIDGLTIVEEFHAGLNVLSEEGVRTVAATYHQKTVLVDYDTDSKAVGFVMGHNMLKNYMDDREHRMFGSAVRYPEFGPWQDISSRVRGACLEDLAKNFQESWPEAIAGTLKAGNKLDPETGSPLVGAGQVVRTALNPGGRDPEENAPALGAVNDWVATKLENMCNLLEKALGEAPTRFDESRDWIDSRVEALKEQINDADLSPIQRAMAKADLEILEAGRSVGGMAGNLPNPPRDATQNAVQRTVESASRTAQQGAAAYEENEERLRRLLITGTENAGEGLKQGTRMAQAQLEAQRAVASDETPPAVKGQDAMSIYDTYKQAIHECSQFLYTENQYFRHENLAKLATARAKEHTDKGGQALHWFVVTNHPVTPGEAPNTEKMLRELGQHERLGQIARHTQRHALEQYKKDTAELEDINDDIRDLENVVADGNSKLTDIFSSGDAKQERIDELEALRKRRAELEKSIGDVEAANPGIKDYGDSPPSVFDVKEANQAFKTAAVKGLKILVGTLASYHRTSSATPCLYTNIYVHSKLLVVDDAFMSLGSANINRRSMHVDAELNINTDSNGTAMNLRKELFKMHTAQEDADSITQTFKNWQELMDNNWRRMHRGEPLNGFLIHFCDPDTPPTRPTD